MIFVVYTERSLTFGEAKLHSTQMIDGNASYQNYAIAEQELDRDGRLPLGTAMLAVAALSLLAWAVVLLPVVAILH